METDVQTMFEIEKELMYSFQQYVFLLKNTHNEYFLLEKAEELFYKLQSEEGLLHLNTLSLEELDELLELVETKVSPYDIDFEMIYLKKDSSSPWERLYAQLKCAWLLKTKEYFQNHARTEEEKNYYYQELFRFRLLDSFFQNHFENQWDYTEEYIELYYRLLYSCPRLGGIEETFFLINEYVEGKEVSLKDYENFEKQELESIIKGFLEDYRDLEDNEFYYYFQDIYFLSYFLLYLRLALNYFSCEQIDDFIINIIQDKQRQSMIQKIVYGFGKKTPYLRLVPKTNNEYNKES